MVKVTELPHDGRMIMGGKGVVVPFKIEPASDHHESPADPEPLMKGARSDYEQNLMDWLGGEARSPLRQQAESDANQTPAGVDDPPEPTAMSLDEVISKIWQVNPEGASALTPRERRAVELYASQHYTGPWFLKQMLSGGWEHCLRSAWTGPNLYGLA